MILTKRVSRLFRKDLVVFRCETDRRLVTESQSCLSAHGGHTLKQPVDVSLIEWILIQLGVIR